MDSAVISRRNWQTAPAFENLSVRQNLVTSRGYGTIHPFQ